MLFLTVLAVRTGVLAALAPLETVLLVPALQNRAMLALTAWNRALVVPLVLGVWNLVLDAPGALTCMSQLILTGTGWQS